MGSIDLAGLRAQWVDLAMLGWLGVSMLIGLARGLLLESLALIGWGVAYVGAHWAAPTLAPHLPFGTPGSALNHAAGFVCAFVAALLAWGLASRLLGLLLRATPLDLGDRLLGAGFGALRGTLVLLVVATVVGLTPLAGSLAWKRSQCAAWLNEALHGLKPWLPSELSQHLPA